MPPSFRNVMLPMLKRSVRSYFLFFSLLCLLCLELVPSIAVPAQANMIQSVRYTQRTTQTANYSCNDTHFSPDGNPFPICPGPFPTGGNCVWWAWEQWHQLGYNLPLNWGNAADWIVDAERAGLPMGTTPHVGSILVMPRNDGVWAGGFGHVAFVTWVGADGDTFNVTYQNYGDPTQMYVGTGYHLSEINQPQAQAGQTRFIYFPRQIDPKLFAKLPGINGSDTSGLGQQQGSAVTQSSASKSQGAVQNSLATSRVALGLPLNSSEQEFNVDFSGSGFSDLLLYNRGLGRLQVLHWQNKDRQDKPTMPRSTEDELGLNSHASSTISLSDSTTGADGWGSSQDIHIGDFSGEGKSQILLYNRDNGQVQLLSLTSDLRIEKHVVLSGWGAGWELYVGKFDGKRTGLFMYNRFANPDQMNTTTPAPPADQTLDSTTGTVTSNPVPVDIQPIPTKMPVKQPTPSPQPKTQPTPTPVPTKDPTPTPKPPTATTTPTETKPVETVTSQPTVTLVPFKTPTAASKSKGDILSILHSLLPFVNSPDPTNPGTGQSDLSGTTPSTAEKQGRSANIQVLNFGKDLQVDHFQQYTLWHNSWEVYVAPFAKAGQDGLFIYDRTTGEGRIMNVQADMQLANEQVIHNLTGNWEVHSGDFIGTGRSQLLMYDPSSGDAQVLSFKDNLALDKQQKYSNWGTNQLLYSGHFGSKQMSVMLYDPQAAKSTFIGLDPSLAQSKQFTTQSWDQNWQVLIGSFVDRSKCLATSSCEGGDDILVLNRQTGAIQQYAFSFGQPISVLDNRSQPYVRDGVGNSQRVDSIETTSFTLLSTFQTSIHNEELY